MEAVEEVTRGAEYALHRRRVCQLHDAVFHARLLDESKARGMAGQYLKRAYVIEALMDIAAGDPERWVCQIAYIDSTGTVTSRPVSPIRRLTEESVRVYCLARQEIRTLKFSRILRCQLRLACDVLTPEQLQVMVDHKKRRRR